MLLARRWAGALVVENTVYVIGGIGGKGGTYEKRLDSVESSYRQGSLQCPKVVDIGDSPNFRPTVR